MWLRLLNDRGHAFKNVDCWLDKGNKQLSPTSDEPSIHPDLLPIRGLCCSIVMSPYLLLCSCPNFWPLEALSLQCKHMYLQFPQSHVWLRINIVVSRSFPNLKEVCKSGYCRKNTSVIMLQIRSAWTFCNLGDTFIQNVFRWHYVTLKKNICCCRQRW